MKIDVFLILAVLLVAVPAIQAAEVKNLVNGQRGSQAFARYDLVGRIGEKEAEVTVFIEVASERYPADKLTLKGAYGPKVKVGSGKEIVWDVAADLPGGYEGDIVWDVEASGGVQATTAVTGGAYSDPTTGMQFVGVKGGCYQMGNSFGDGEVDEKPVHEVCVDDFGIGRTEVTVDQFRSFVTDKGFTTDAEKDGGCYVWNGATWDKNAAASWRSPGFSQEPTHPVTCVSWNDATAFASWLSRKSGRTVRLPTEAEWEYAARSGGRSDKYVGGNDIDSVAWYNGNSGNKTHPVGVKAANGTGLYDMTGNVWEWCSDWHGIDYYANSPRNNPAGPSSGSYRVIRGGSWLNAPWYARTSIRYAYFPGNRGNGLGFRLASPAVR